MADSPVQPLSPAKLSKKKPPKAAGKRRVANGFDVKSVRSDSYKPMHEKEKPSDLPRWARLAIAESVMIGSTLKDIAPKYGRSISSLGAYNRSPAGRIWRKELAEIADSPEKVAMAMMRSSAAHVALDYLAALDSAIESGDYREVGVMSRDLLDRLDMRKSRKESPSGPTLVINLGGSSSFEVPMIESSFEESIEEAEYEVVSDSDRS